MRVPGTVQRGHLKQTEKFRVTDRGQQPRPTEFPLDSAFPVGELGSSGNRTSRARGPDHLDSPGLARALAQFPHQAKKTLRTCLVDFPCLVVEIPLTRNPTA